MKKDMDKNIKDEELYLKTKKGVERKMKKRIYRKKQIVSGLLVAIFLVGINGTAYATSENYRNWLSKQLGIEQQDTIMVEKSAENQGIEMQVVSYYRTGNTVVMLLKFHQTNGEVFVEDMNVERIDILENEKSSGDMVSCFTALSDDKQNMLATITMNVTTEQVCINAKNLTSMMTGEQLFTGEWQLEIPVSEITGEITKNRNVNPVTVSIRDKKYKIEEVQITKTVLLFQCNVENQEASDEDRFSSEYGVPIVLEYKNGEKCTDYYCIPNEEGQLIVAVWDSKELENISQMYVNQETVLK